MLKATLLIRPRQGRPAELRAWGTLSNTGTVPIAIDLAPLSSPSLALQIEDAGGARVALPPPPVPGGLTSLVTLAPGEGHTVDLGMFLPSWIGAGRYRVCLHYLSQAGSFSAGAWSGEVSADWVAIDVVC